MSFGKICSESLRGLRADIVTSIMIKNRAKIFHRGLFPDLVTISLHRKLLTIRIKHVWITVSQLSAQ